MRLELQLAEYYSDGQLSNTKVDQFGEKAAYEEDSFYPNHPTTKDELIGTIE